MKKDNTFKTHGIFIGVGVAAVMAMMIYTEHIGSWGDILVCIFAVSLMEVLCLCAHRTINR